MVMNIRYPQSTNHNHTTAGDSLAIFPGKKQAITTPIFSESIACVGTDGRSTSHTDGGKKINIRQKDLVMNAVAAVRSVSWLCHSLITLSSVDYRDYMPSYRLR
jgi:hypothetical protein